MILFIPVSQSNRRPLFMSEPPPDVYSRRFVIDMQVAAAKTDAKDDRTSEALRVVSFLLDKSNR